MDVDTENKLQHQSLRPKRLKLEYLKDITNQFSKDRILGSGGFGIVYKGKTDDGEVAVKLFKMPGTDDKQFLNEAEHLMDLRHPNIVKLEGYCYHIEKESVFHEGSPIWADDVVTLLCFEYMSNGSLDKHLNDESSGLHWHERYNIIEGICKGLHYLHEGRRGIPILHLDLKPSNILLDKNMVPKIADFGLSRLFGEEKTHTFTTSVIGSRGYMPPELLLEKCISRESDIYSLGVIVMEIVTGYRKYPDNTTTEECIEVTEKWRRRLQRTSKYTSLEEDCRQVKRCIEVGLKCMERNRKNRPNMRAIIEMLNGSESMISPSVRENSSDVAEKSGEAVPADWREALGIVASYFPEQSVKGMEVLCRELTQAADPESTVLEYFIKEADSLVSCLSVMVKRIFSSSLSETSLKSREYALNTLMKTFQIKRLAHAVKEGTLENLITELLFWLLDERVLMDDGKQLLKALMLEILENAERTSSFIALINLLRPLDPAKWPSTTSSDPLAARNQKISDLVVKCLIKWAKVLQSTIDEVDIDRILQAIHVYLQELGIEEIRIRAEADDKPLRMVKTVLHELVRLRGAAIKGHLSMVPTDAEPRPIILGYVDIDLQILAAARG